MALAVSVWSSVITGGAGVAGVVVGTVLTKSLDGLARRGQARRELDAAGLHVLARAEKIDRAERRGYWQTRSNEIYYLGTDLDRYLAAIAGADRKAPNRARHWKVYKAAVPAVIDRNTRKIPEIIADLRCLRADLEGEIAGRGKGGGPRTLRPGWASFISSWRPQRARCSRSRPA
jgi:hypothetical protein